MQASDCGIGQVCTSGVCADDPSPAVAQCTFDTDCGTAFRCINAYCHPLCTTDSQCASHNVCDNGVCRAAYRPAA
jgi:Cys-rich repeat protein